MAGSPLLTRLNELEQRVLAQEKITHQLTARFAWYYHGTGNGNRYDKRFAIITKINKDKADMVVFNAGWSGGTMQTANSPLRIVDERFPEEEQDFNGTWEPMMDITEILRAAGREEIDPEAEGEEAANATNTAVATAS